MIQNRIEILLQLNEYIQNNDAKFQSIKELAERQNGWFTQDNIELALSTICEQYLNKNQLIQFANTIETSESKNKSLLIGITMAGNIPLVGFHDFLCVFLSGHRQLIKFSSKDDILLPHLIQKIYEWDDTYRKMVASSEMLKGCDVYIATGSNNSARYFEKYFAKYPHIIRRNRTSVAILNGQENKEDLENLAKDVYQYFGLGCRNVTKLFVPRDYDFIPLLEAFKIYDDVKNHNKFRNNFDYNLALYILNNQYYMSNESLLLVENSSLFSSIAVLNYEYYDDIISVKNSLHNHPDIQAIIGKDFLPFGTVQCPAISDFADGVNTIEFLNSL